MARSAAYKRKLRLRQKLKKRRAREKKLPQPAEVVSSMEESGMVRYQESEDDRSKEPAVSGHEALESSSKDIKIKELTKEVKAAFKRIDYYQGVIDKQEKVIDVMEGACVNRIKSVRHFWRDLIYEEGSRSGKILKRAMQNTKQ